MVVGGVAVRLGRPQGHGRGHRRVDIDKDVVRGGSLTAGGLAGVAIEENSSSEGERRDCIVTALEREAS